MANSYNSPAVLFGERAVVFRWKGAVPTAHAEVVVLEMARCQNGGCSKICKKMPNDAEVRGRSLVSGRAFMHGWVV